MYIERNKKTPVFTLSNVLALGSGGGPFPSLGSNRFATAYHITWGPSSPSHLLTLLLLIPYLNILNRTILYLNTFTRTIPYLNTLNRPIPYLNTLNRTIPYLNSLNRTIPNLNTLNRTLSEYITVGSQSNSSPQPIRIEESSRLRLKTLLGSRLDSARYSLS